MHRQKTTLMFLTQLRTGKGRKVVGLVRDKVGRLLSMYVPVTDTQEQVILKPFYV